MFLNHPFAYEQLPPHFFSRIDPTPVANPQLIAFNRPLAAELHLDVGSLDDGGLAALFAGNVLAPGSRPLAMAYAGHQFGHFVPQLGDGRAILLGEVRDGHGRYRDVQLKGSGRTPYSRGGDGRAAVGPVLREYLVSEAMHALGIPTTRSLAAVTTGEGVMREARLPGAILTRVAASHVRVGTFQFFGSRGDVASVKRLADFVIERLYPEIAGAENPYLELLRSVVRRQASLVAAWMNVGFIHGVMNTDNMAVSGETIDFGPCAFMDRYDPLTVFSSIDSQGRYAFGNQPAAAAWNLARLAEALLPCIDPDRERAVESATAAIGMFAGQFSARWLAGMREKMGLCGTAEGDAELAEGLLDAMRTSEADFTVTFRGLCAAAENGGTGGVLDHAAFHPWIEAWRSRLAGDPQTAGERAARMRTVNPAVIPRNHRIEQAIDAALAQDYAPFEALSRALSRPYEEPMRGEFALPPQPDERVLQTFCGT